MEVITKEFTTTRQEIWYKSFDGQEFQSEEECQKFENSAIGALIYKLKDFIVNKITEDELLAELGGSEVWTVYFVCITSESIDILNQIMFLTVANEQLREKYIKKYSDSIGNDYAIIGITNEEGDYATHVYGTLSSIKNHFDSFVVKKE